MPIVNGHDIECGCYVEGHWGQYGPDHLADQAEGLGWTPAGEGDDPRAWRAGQAAEDPEVLDYIVEAADAIEAWLNDHTEAGFGWLWRDGEFFLSPICENGDCDDDTCAHWD